jgi:hypothetical protein
MHMFSKSSNDMIDLAGRERYHVGNIFVINVKYRESLQDVQDKYYKPTNVQDKYYKPLVTVGH